MTLAVEDFKQTMRRWASGVTIVTCQHPQIGIQGMTATAFTSVSLEPPTVLVCINQAVTSAEAICHSGRFAINLLRADQADYSNRFASPLPPAKRFEAVPWQAGTAGVPLLTESLATLECRLIQQLQSGTHWIFIAEVEKVQSQSGEPLIYFDGGYANLNNGDK